MHLIISLQRIADVKIPRNRLLAFNDLDDLYYDILTVRIGPVKTKPVFS